MTDQQLQQAPHVLSIKDVSERTGFSEPTLRYYEEIGLIPPVPRGDTSGHRQYGSAEMYPIEVLACLRVAGLGVADMKRYVAALEKGNEAAGDLVDLFDVHGKRLQNEIEALQVRKRYVDAKIALWESRRDGDAAKEETAFFGLLTAIGELAEHFKD